jgi:hypothetical protein
VTTAAAREAERDRGAASDWFLSREERGNPATTIDDHAEAGTAWSLGNVVRPLVHGRAYFKELLAGVRRLERGDLLLFTDWRGDADERLDGPDTEVARVFTEAAGRGVIVKALVWRSHSRLMQLSEPQNRRFAELLSQAGAEPLLDTRVRIGGSHHQKLVVLRYRGRPELDVAYVGGIDLCHGRNDDERHDGDPQPPPIAHEYGERPPWHDIQVASAGTIRRWRPPTPSGWPGTRPTTSSSTGTPSRRNCPIRSRPAATPCSSCGRTRTGGPDIRSRRRASGAWRAATSRRSPGPGA